MWSDRENEMSSGIGARIHSNEVLPSGNTRIIGVVF